MFDAFYPFDARPGTQWIEWFEALLSNEHLLVRCVPLVEHQLPNSATSILLNFGRVIAFRAAQDPYTFSQQAEASKFPREANRTLSSQLMRTTRSSWIEQAQNWHPIPMHHYVLVSTQDQVLEALTYQQEPIVTLEREAVEPNPYPKTFLVLPNSAK